jgi:ribonuclease-3
VPFFQKNSEKRPPPISPDRKKELHLFERQLGIRFRRLSLLNHAFSHRSYANELDSTISDNEKLEFLGDSILGLVVSEYLYNHLTKADEGDLAKIKSVVVSETSLEKIAKNVKVDNFILISKGEEYSGGRSKKAILADAMEAIFGAYYSDSGFKAARDFILALLVPEVAAVLENRHQKDYKTLLQELVQKKLKTYPKYVIVRRSGPDHDQTFWMEVRIGGRSYGPGKGKNKKDAEQRAAERAFKALNARSKQRHLKSHGTASAADLHKNYRP